MRRLLDKLFTPVDASSLGAFRILFGALMLYDVAAAFRHDAIRKLYLDPPLLFPYEWFPFVRPWPGDLLYVHFALMGLAAAGILLGYHYRLAVGLFLATYGYVFLLDKAHYNNHYYLIILLSFLLLVVDGQRWASLDQRRRRTPAAVPFWNLFVLRAQMLLVFFYAGIAKLNPDWLAGEPMRTWLAVRAETPVIGPWLASQAAAYAFSYAGLLFDLLVGFLLLSRRTLPIALVGLLLFNLTNNWLFRIGVFPFLVLATAVLFEEPDLPRRAWEAVVRRFARAPASARSTSALDASAPVSSPPELGSRTWNLARLSVCSFLAVYLAVQVALPLRHWLYRGNVNWTEEGHRFSWHMKLRTKRGEVRFWVTDPATGKRFWIDPSIDLTPRQHRNLTGPDMIVQYAHFLKQKLAERGIENAMVQAETLVSLNRRPPQPIVDPQVDLASVAPRVFEAGDWIVPLDLNGKPGTVPRPEYGALGLRRPQARAQRP